ncbi:GNAT family N-acetyltransferase [Streptomyces sp. NEAU-H3]|uniref:GNAT family N-acetyltransferase n=1 Tax=Streptomyces sp. NEAU-H3 TaxID=2720636 RepID=UPI0014396678|nr:GNAT family N-acetyltransferase [Streptomyces sp. NEAU-H3]NJA57614.1 GNAT family N-acetyltransferase [Streptomyces sp. NEAU-H3]
MHDLPLAARLTRFRASVARRQAPRVAEVPGGLAVLDDEFPLSHEHNQLLLTEPKLAPDDLPALADELFAHLPHRRLALLDGTLTAAYADVLTRAGYAREDEVVMVQLAGPYGRRLRAWMPEAGPEVLRQLVARRPRRLAGADDVRFLASYAENGEIASWADLYLDRAAGIAQTEDVVTAEAHLGHGHGGAVLATALHLAAGAGCRTRFLVADAADWPREWYRRRGYRVVGASSGFVRTG